MAKIELRKAYFRGFQFTTGPARGEGVCMVIASFAAPWTEKHRQSGGWEEIPETVSGGIHLKPSRIAGTHMEFIPQGGLEKHAISLDIASVDDCTVFVPKKDGEEREMRFHIRTAILNAEKQFGALGRTVGQGAGILKLTYDAEAQQRLIEGNGGEEGEDGQQELEEQG